MVNALITKMSTRKRRDNLILGGVIGIGLLLITLYLML